MSTEAGLDIEGVLAGHADCELNAAQDVGAVVAGLDAWSCGITLPFDGSQSLEDVERAHVAAAVRAHLAALTTAERELDEARAAVERVKALRHQRVRIRRGEQRTDYVRWRDIHDALDPTTASDA